MSTHAQTQGPDGARQSGGRDPQMVVSNGTASVHLTLAVCDYEHVREITQGIVRADGITLTPLIFPSIEEITFRFTRSLEWDVSELSFGKYISLCSQGNAPMLAIPVFPSRVHRHSAICAPRPRHQDSQGPRRPRGRNSGMGADCRHLCPRNS